MMFFVGEARCERTVHPARRIRVLSRRHTSQHQKQRSLGQREPCCLPSGWCCVLMVYLTVRFWGTLPGSGLHPHHNSC